MNYKISGAVCTGAHHLESGIPCQDRIAVCRGKDVFCAALADGAGSRENSDQGAECVVQCTARLLSRRFDELWEMGEDALAGHLLNACIQALGKLAPPLRELASTLLFFAGRRDGRYLSGHLGDGVQILVQDGKSAVFSPPENGEYHNETVFVTSESAQEHFRLRRGRLEGSGALLLMSDGMAESLYQRDTGTPAPACRTIAGWLQADGDEETVSRALESNMRGIFFKHSRDDLSLAAIAWEQGPDAAE